MNTRIKLFSDFSYREVLDLKTRELIRTAVAAATGCPDWLTKHFAVAKQAGASEEELREAVAYGIIGPSGKAKNFVKRTLPELVTQEKIDDQ